MIYIEPMYFCTQNSKQEAQELHNFSLLHIRTAHEDARLEHIEYIEIMKFIKEEMEMAD